MRSLTQLFTHLSVGKKLALGFGMVLLLTLAVAATGFVAVDATVARSQQISQVAQINADILDARGLERDYALTRQEQSATALGEVLGKLNRELDALAADVRRFADGAEQADDITLLSVRWNGFLPMYAAGADQRWEELAIGR